MASTQPDPTTLRLAAKFDTLLSLLDDVKGPHHKDSPGIQKPLLKAAAVFAVAVLEATADDLCKKAKVQARGLAGRMAAVAPLYEVPVPDGLLKWVRGLVEFRNGLLHVDPPPASVKEFILDAGLPLDSDQLGPEHLRGIEKGFSEASQLLVRVAMRQRFGREHWADLTKIEPLPRTRFRP